MTDLSSARTVLLVGPDESIEERRFLEALGLRWVPARSVEEALDALDARPIDLVLICSLQELSDGDAFTLCWRIRERDLERRMPVILLTWKFSTADLERAARSGADDYLLNPALLRELERSIRDPAASQADVGAQVIELLPLLSSLDLLAWSIGERLAGKPPAIAPEDVLEGTGRPPQVLLVSRKEEAPESYQGWLEDLGFQVELSTQADAVMPLLSRDSSRFDVVVLMTVGKPEALDEALELCRRIRLEVVDPPRLALVTASTLGDVWVKALGAGVDLCVPKPFNMDDFVSRLRALAFARRNPFAGAG